MGVRQLIFTAAACTISAFMVGCDDWSVRFDGNVVNERDQPLTHTNANFCYRVSEIIFGCESVKTDSRGEFQFEKSGSGISRTTQLSKSQFTLTVLSQKIPATTLVADSIDVTNGKVHARLKGTFKLGTTSSAKSNRLEVMQPTNTIHEPRRTSSSSAPSVPNQNDSDETHSDDSEVESAD